MSVSSHIEHKVYCDGGWHQPLEGRVQSKAEIANHIRSAGWTMKSDGTTYCREHRPKR